MIETKNSNVVQKTIKIIYAFIDERDQWGVRDLAKHLDLPISTLHRLLRNLQHEGFLEYNTVSRKYEVGIELMRIGSVLSSKMDFKKVARPYLEKFVKDFDETICLVMYHKRYRKVVFIEQLIGSSPFQYVINIGDLQPVPYGSSGKSILAYLPEEEIDEIINEEGFDPNHQLKLNQELQKIRQKGIALSSGERIKGARGIASPIFDSTHRPIGSVVFAAPIKHLEDHYVEKLSKEMKQIAANISNKLGHF